MLVLGRRLEQKIIINDDITITVVAIDGQKVRLGIEAPRAVRVDRSEVRARKLEAAKTVTTQPS